MVASRIQISAATRPNSEFRERGIISWRLGQICNFEIRISQGGYLSRAPRRTKIQTKYEMLVVYIFLYIYTWIYKYSYKYMNVHNIVRCPSIKVYMLQNDIYIYVYIYIYSFKLIRQTCRCFLSLSLSMASGWNRRPCSFGNDLKICSNFIFINVTPEISLPPNQTKQTHQ